MARTDGLYNLMQRQAIDEMLKLASSGNKRKIVRAFDLAEKITPDAHKRAVRLVRDKVEADHPALLMARHVADGLNPRCRERFIECVVINTLLRGSAKRKAFEETTGKRAPTVILVSPTMRCNLACEGCYAAEYDTHEDLDRGLLQSIVEQGNEMGVYTFAILGGEPFVYRDLIGFARENPDSYFQVYTNGTLINDRNIEEMAVAGNVAPMLSIEGTAEMTDVRRGSGVHRRVMSAMERLGEAGVPFGYSVTVTRINWRTLISDEFVDPLIARGAVIGWHFLYMPIGRVPNAGLMPTPEEREEFRRGIQRLRATRPFFPVDFWGDAPYVGGCIAGKHYMHITSEGWVEPCIFTHFATDNIHDVSLADAFNSLYFREIRYRQPFNDNLLLPCMWLDNPKCSREIMQVTGARPTHDGADVMLTDLRDGMDAYSEEAVRVMGTAWSRMQAERSGGE